MYIRADLHYNKEDILYTIERLSKIVEEIEAFGFNGNIDAMQEAIDVLYEIVENA